MIYMQSPLSLGGMIVMHRVYRARQRSTLYAIIVTSSAAQMWLTCGSLGVLCGKLTKLFVYHLLKAEKGRQAL